MSRRLLVVCTANQCRSPMAAGIIGAHARQAGLELRVKSAGTWAVPDHPATANAVTTMAERDIDIAAHRSQPIDDTLIGEADLVLVMTRGHQEALTAEYPDHAAKLMLFSELAGGRWDIDDPVGEPLSAYRATADELQRLIEAGWSSISAAGRDTGAGGERDE